MEDGMPHWFDEFTKGLTIESPSRRTLLRVVVGAGVFGSISKLLRPTAIWAQSIPSRGAPIPGCMSQPTVDGFHLDYSVHTSFQRHGLTLTGYSGGRANSIVQDKNDRTKLAGGVIKSPSQMEITLDGKLVVKIETHFSGDFATKDRSLHMNYEYGPAVKGIRRAEFSGVNGQFNGSIDGRSLRPFSGARIQSMEQVEFTDGNPAPRITIDPDLLTAIKSLLQKT